MTLSVEQQEMQGWIDTFMNRVEVHGVDLLSRVFYKRPSGDPVEFPLSIGEVIQIFGYASTFLTDDEFTAKVNTEANSGLDMLESQRIERFVAQIDKRMYDDLMHVSRKQAEVIANLVQLLMTSGVKGNAIIDEVQRGGDAGINSGDVRSSPEGSAAGEEDDSAQGGRDRGPVTESAG